MKRFAVEYDGSGAIARSSGQRDFIWREMLQGRVALVTGSTSGIGLGVASCLAREGCSVVLHGSRDPSAAEEAIRTITSKYEDAKVLYLQASLTSPELAATTLIEKTIQEFSRIDILVNNAGIQHVSPIESFASDMWDRVIAVNLTSCFQTMKQAIPHMQSNNFGRIINISSVHGVVASTGKAAYVAAKHGLNGLTKVVALENAGKGITCNAICPGWVLTDLVQKQIDNIASERQISNEEATAFLLSSKEPTKQFTTPEHIGDMVVFLCGSAGSNMTG
eukprot:CAMPEP_0206210934 /NCGR_PEP_ID=MMETSP0166-20121206/17834_1 /ASSEMBLY_ACC=CAM_ASM_000260 /TAXON_ID=95228 /ORGANISM="Vannella robusta, Strain DIVA3 518/3/11/1/6" /LENGTH=277 /DNA_ID=CAMNT_0053632685 /DNA_START=596 /DNA_END=1426 /DNA_ORIENTATION=+